MASMRSASRRDVSLIVERVMHEDEHGPIGMRAEVCVQPIALRFTEKAGRDVGLVERIEKNDAQRARIDDGDPFVRDGFLTAGRDGKSRDGVVAVIMIAERERDRSLVEQRRDTFAKALIIFRVSGQARQIAIDDIAIEGLGGGLRDGELQIFKREEAAVGVMDVGGNVRVGEQRPMQFRGRWSAESAAGKQARGGSEEAPAIQKNRHQTSV